MVIKGIEEDYSMDKARIDASGYDFTQSLRDSCDICGNRIKDGEMTELLNGTLICENCVRES